MENLFGETRYSLNYAIKNNINTFLSRYCCAVVEGKPNEDYEYNTHVQRYFPNAILTDKDSYTFINASSNKIFDKIMLYVSRFMTYPQGDMPESLARYHIEFAEGENFVDIYLRMSPLQNDRMLNSFKNIKRISKNVKDRLLESGVEIGVLYTCDIEMNHLYSFVGSELENEEEATNEICQLILDKVKGLDKNDIAGSCNIDFTVGANGNWDMYLYRERKIEQLLDE